MPASSTNVLITLGIAMLFSGIFLFGGRLAYRPGQHGRRRFLSFAAGISVAYTFVHVLPALHGMREISAGESAAMHRMFPEYSVYLWTMVGFLIFYGLNTMLPASHRNAKGRDFGDVAVGAWQPWIHIGGFAVYGWLLTYLMIWTGKDLMALSLYALAMGMHIFPITCNLATHYPSAYSSRGAFLLALAPPAGWACGFLFEMRPSVLMNLVALVAGGVILNTAITELPHEQEGRFWPFLAGAMSYTALLLLLSHFEK